ncbi:unnamed protein product [Lampetra planeri]
MKAPNQATRASTAWTGRRQLLPARRAQRTPLGCPCSLDKSAALQGTALSPGPDDVQFLMNIGRRGLVLKRDRARELGTRSEGTAAPLVSESKSPGGTSDVIPASLVPHGDLRPFASARQRALVAARAPATRHAQSTRNGVVPA